MKNEIGLSFPNSLVDLKLEFSDLKAESVAASGEPAVALEQLRL